MEQWPGARVPQSCIMGTPPFHVPGVPYSEPRSFVSMKWPREVRDVSPPPWKRAQHGTATTDGQSKKEEPPKSGSSHGKSLVGLTTHAWSSLPLACPVTRGEFPGPPVLRLMSEDAGGGSRPAGAAGGPRRAGSRAAPPGEEKKGNLHDLERERAGDSPGGESGSLGYLPGQGVFRRRAVGFLNALALGEMPGEAQHPSLQGETGGREGGKDAPETRCSQ